MNRSPAPCRLSHSPVSQRPPQSPTYHQNHPDREERGGDLIATKLARPHQGTNQSKSAFALFNPSLSYIAPAPFEERLVGPVFGSLPHFSSRESALGLPRRVDPLVRAPSTSSQLWSTTSHPSILDVSGRSPPLFTRSKLELVPDERPGLFRWAGTSRASLKVRSGTSSAQGASKACSGDTDAPSRGTPMPSSPTPGRWNLRAVGLTLELLLTFKAPMRARPPVTSDGEVTVAAVRLPCATESLASPRRQNHYASLGRPQANPTLKSRCW